MVRKPGGLPFPGWAVTVFACALGARLLFLFAADQPLLYTHQYGYFHNALRIATNPHPLDYILRDEEWRTWDRNWTIAPLYYVFAAAVLKLFALHLTALQVVQCLLDSGVAVLVAAMGRRVAGPWGAAAGIAYAFYAPAIEMPSWVLTENLHTPLFVLGLWLTIRAWEETPRRGPYFIAGLVLGISALARSVTSAFMGVLAIVSLLFGTRPGRLRCVIALTLGGACAILPWTARNVFVVGDPILIESTAFENIWFANRFVEGDRFLRQEAYVHSRPTPAEKRAAALQFAKAGIERRPDLFVAKIGRNFWHLLRPEGLQNLLAADRSEPRWRQAFAVVLDDLPLFIMTALFPVFLIVGPVGPTRRAIVAWSAYYLLMIVVVFHNEIRYRSVLVPFLFVAAAGAIPVLRGKRLFHKWFALAAGVAAASLSVAPFIPLASQVLAARGQVGAAAAALRPGAADPWFDEGKQLARKGQWIESAAAYERGEAIRRTASVRGEVALPRVLRNAGRTDAANAALRDLHRFEWDFDPWLLQQAAWRELEAPRTSDLVIGGDDSGAILGFFHPRGDDPRMSAHRLEWNKYAPPGPVPPPGLHRWTRHRAFIRIEPEQQAAAYRVTITMGSPFPSPHASPNVTVRIGGRNEQRTLNTELRDYVFENVKQDTGSPAIVIRIDCPTWNAVGEPAEQGIRVDRVRVEPI